MSQAGDGRDQSELEFQKLDDFDEAANEVGLEEEGEEEEEEETGEDKDEEAQELVGHRLQLIPHDVAHARVFRFEFGPAILAQVLEKIDPLNPVPLSSVDREAAPYPGFYQLFRAGQSKYIGRTIRPIYQRLAEHVKKLRGRVPLDEMTCRFLFVEDISLVGISEDSLITYFHPLGLDEWGKMGFGSKATGHGRAGQSSEWHEANLPDLKWPVTAGGPKAKTLRHLVRQIARGAPLTLSIPTDYSADFDRAFPDALDVTASTMPFEDWIAYLEPRLGETWRIDRRPMAWYIVPA